MTHLFLVHIVEKKRQLKNVIKNIKKLKKKLRKQNKNTQLPNKKELYQEIKK